MAAQNSRLRTPKRALHYLATFAARLETDPGPDTIAAVQTAQRVVETALRLMDVDALQRRVDQLEDHIRKCREQKRVP